MNFLILIIEQNKKLRKEISNFMIEENPNENEE